MKKKINFLKSYGSYKYEGISEVLDRKSITPNDFFKKILPQKPGSNEDKKSGRFLLEGRLGTGKTTFSQFLAHHWMLAKESDESSVLSGENWEQFDLVLFVPFRRLKQSTSKKVTPLAEIIKDEYFRLSELTANSIQKILEKLEETKKILYLLDGYDEIDAQVSNQYDNLIVMLQRIRYWIVTARPYFFNKDILGPYQHIETMGLSIENIKNFSTCYFRTVSKLDQLEYFLVSLFSHPDLIKFSQISVILNHLCNVATLDGNCVKQLEEHIFFKKNISEIYGLIEEAAFNHYVSRMESTGGTSKNDFSFLEQLAWKFLHKGITTGDFYSNIESREKEDSEISKNIIQNAGLVEFSQNAADAAGKDKYINRHCRFIHASFRDYFAAKYLASSLCIDSKNASTEKKERKEEALTYLKEKAHDRNLALFWRFATGFLLLKEEKDIKSFFESRAFELSEKNDLERVMFIMNCLNETSKIKEKKFFKDLREKLIKDRLIKKWIESKRFWADSKSLSETDRMYPNIIIEEIVQRMIREMEGRWFGWGQEIDAKIIGELFQNIQSKALSADTIKSIVNSKLIKLLSEEEKTLLQLMAVFQAITSVLDNTFLIEKNAEVYKPLTDSTFIDKMQKLFSDLSIDVFIDIFSDGIFSEIFSELFSDLLSAMHYEEKPILKTSVKLVDSNKEVPLYSILIALFSNLGAACVLQDNFEKAKYLFTWIVKASRLLGVSDHNTIYATITLWRILGKHTEAKKLWEQVLSIQETHDPEDSYAKVAILTHLGNASAALGELEKAERLLEEALTLNDAYDKNRYEVIGVLDNLAAVYGALEKPEKQQALLNRALDLRAAYYGAEHPQVLLAKFNAAFDSEQLQEALEYGEKYLKNSSKPEIIYHNLACVCHVVSDFSKADRFFLLAIDAYPNAGVYCEYAHFLFAQKRFKEVISRAQAALDNQVINELFYDFKEMACLESFIASLVEEKKAINFNSHQLAFYLKIKAQLHLNLLPEAEQTLADWQKKNEQTKEENQVHTKLLQEASSKIQNAKEQLQGTYTPKHFKPASSGSRVTPKKNVLGTGSAPAPAV